MPPVTSHVTSHVTTHVTLVLTRKPAATFVWKKGYEPLDVNNPADMDAAYGPKRNQTHYGGRWGTLAIVEGPQVFSGAFVAGTAPPAAAPPPTSGPAPAGTPLPPSELPEEGKANTPAHQAARIGFAGRTLELMTDGGDVKQVTELNSMERFGSDTGSDDKRTWYMQLHPQPEKPYPLTYETDNPVVAKLVKSGRCFRVHGHHQMRLPPNESLEAGILIHEAPNIGWLIGCISPRLLGFRSLDYDMAPTTKAFDAILKAVNASRSGGKADLLVLDS